MYWNNLSIGTMKRETSFRFQVAGLHYCKHHILPEHGPFQNSIFEVCIRLNSAAEWCEDTINGKKIHIPYPNVVWKRPGQASIIRSPLPRDNIAFHYTPEVMEDFFRIGMEPQSDHRSFDMTPEITLLISELHRSICNLYSPGVPDRIDWICFQLYKTFLSIPEKKETPARTLQTETLIRNISMWLQTHYNESIDTTALARDHGMSRARFYAEWKRIFDISPVQYVLERRLESAAHFLRFTDLTIERIVHEVHFSNMYAFHKRFREKFGMTPAQFRKEWSIAKQES